MSLLEGVRIGEAHHVYSWGNPDEADPDENVCHVWEGSLQITLRRLEIRVTAVTFLIYLQIYE